MRELGCLSEFREGGPGLTVIGNHNHNPDHTHRIGVSHPLFAASSFCPPLARHRHYLIMNGVALLAISQHPKFGSNALTTKGLGRYAGALIGGGALVFSGSIFLLLLDRAR